MLTSVIQRANLENLVAEVNSVILKSEIRGYINECATELHDLQVAARGMEFFRKSYTFATESNKTSYTLPADLYETISVDINLGGSIFISARPYNEWERNAYRLVPGWYFTSPVYFRILGSPDSTGANLQPSMISFIPGPNSSVSVTVNYVPVFHTFLTDGTEDGNVYDGVNGWESHIIWNVVAICLEKLKQDSSFARAQVAKATARIEALAPDRHAGDAERVHDSLSSNDGALGCYGGFSGYAG